MHQTNSTASVKSACHSIDGPSRILEIALKQWPHALLTNGEKKGRLQLFRNPPLKYAPVKISATDKLLKVLGNVQHLHKSKKLWPLLCPDILGIGTGGAGAHGPTCGAEPKGKRAAKTAGGSGDEDEWHGGIEAGER